MKKQQQLWWWVPLLCLVPVSGCEEFDSSQEEFASDGSDDPQPAATPRITGTGRVLEEVQGRAPGNAPILRYVTDFDVDYTTEPIEGVAADDFTARLSGLVTPTCAGDYTFTIEATPGTEVILGLDETRPFGDQWTTVGADSRLTANYTIAADAEVGIYLRLRWQQGTSGAVTPKAARILWSSPGCGIVEQPLPSSVLLREPGGESVRSRLYAGSGTDAAPVESRLQAEMNSLLPTSSSGSPHVIEQLGQIKAPCYGEYRFTAWVQGGSIDVTVDGQSVISAPSDAAPRVIEGSPITLDTAQLASVEVALSTDDEVFYSLDWSTTCEPPKHQRLAPFHFVAFRTWADDLLARANSGTSSVVAQRDFAEYGLAIAQWQSAVTPLNNGEPGGYRVVLTGSNAQGGEEVRFTTEGSLAILQAVDAREGDDAAALAAKFAQLSPTDLQSLVPTTTLVTKDGITLTTAQQQEIIASAEASVSATLPSLGGQGLAPQPALQSASAAGPANATGGPVDGFAAESDWSASNGPQTAPGCGAPTEEYGPCTGAKGNEPGNGFAEMGGLRWDRRSWNGYFAASLVGSGFALAGACIAAPVAGCAAVAATAFGNIAWATINYACDVDQQAPPAGLSWVVGNKVCACGAELDWQPKPGLVPTAQAGTLACVSCPDGSFWDASANECRCAVDPTRKPDAVECGVGTDRRKATCFGASFNVCVDLCGTREGAEAFGPLWREGSPVNFQRVGIGQWFELPTHTKDAKVIWCGSTLSGSTGNCGGRWPRFSDLIPQVTFELGTYDGEALDGSPKTYSYGWEGYATSAQGPGRYESHWGYSGGGGRDDFTMQLWQDGELYWCQ